jgi:hypothetical protein
VTAAVALVARLRARGVELVPAGDRLRFRPADALTPAELATLRELKREVLTLLTAPPPFLPLLDPDAVRDMLGERPSPHAVAMLAWDVKDALDGLEAEIASGHVAPGIRLVHGRPLADWLDLGDVARLLRAWRDRRGVAP